MPSDMQGCPLCGDASKTLVCSCCERPFSVEETTALKLKSTENCLFCLTCKQSFPLYLWEDKDLAGQFALLREALVSRNEGRNLDCWPLGSFGWKHADLDPGGCTGIKRIVGVQEDKLLVEVGGHKVFVQADEDDEKGMEDFNTYMQELLIDLPYHCDWSGEDWCVSMSDVIQVKWNDDITGMVDAIYAAAKAAVNPFSESCAKMSIEAEAGYVSIFGIDEDVKK